MNDQTKSGNAKILIIRPGSPSYFQKTPQKLWVGGSVWSNRLMY